MTPGSARAIASELGGALVQRVAAGDDLLVLELRLPGRSVSLALSVMDGAPGVALLHDGVTLGEPQGGLVSFRDHLRGALVPCRFVSARVAGGGRFLALRFEGASGVSELLLDASPRPNLALLRDGESHALRRPHAREGLPEEWAALPPDADDGAEADLHAEGRALFARRHLLASKGALADAAARARGALAAARRLVARRTDDVARLADAPAQRALADALAACLHLVKRGQERVRVTRLDDGSEADVVLDPRLSPGDNLRKAYSRAAKAERGAQEAARLLQEARDKCGALEDCAQQARDLLEAIGDGEPTADDLARIDPLLRRLRPLLPKRAGGGPAAAPARRERQALPEGVREFVSKDGLRILAGKSATTNDLVTFRLARGNDAWFHARDVPGPHVVLVVPKGMEIPQQSLLDAATVAHVLGKLGTEPHGEVIWTRAKDVRRVKGAGPGKVTVTRERVMPVRVEAERVARLRLR